MMMGVIGVSLAGVLTPPMLKPQTAELAFEVAGVLPEALDALGLGFEQIKSGDAGGGDRRRVRGGEKEGPGAVVEVVDEIL